MNKYLIYVLHHPDSKHVYVGKSCSGMKRPKEHGAVGYMKRNKNYPVVRWIEKLRLSGKIYEIAVVEDFVTASDLAETEKFYIAYFRSLGISLLNLTDGGDGTLGAKASAEKRKKLADAARNISSETREKRSISAKKNFTPEIAVLLEKGRLSNKGRIQPSEEIARRARSMTGKHPSSETRKKLSDAKKNQTSETRSKISIANRGKIRSGEMRARMSAERKTRSQDCYIKMWATRRAKRVPRIKLNLIGACA